MAKMLVAHPWNCPLPRVSLRLDIASQLTAMQDHPHVACRQALLALVGWYDPWTARALARIFDGRTRMSLSRAEDSGMRRFLSSRRRRRTERNARSRPSGNPRLGKKDKGLTRQVSLAREGSVGG